MDNVKTIVRMLEECSEFAQNVTFNKDRIRNSLRATYHLDATKIADYLVKEVRIFKGLSFYRIFNIHS